MHANERRHVLRSFCKNENTIFMHAKSFCKNGNTISMHANERQPVLRSFCKNENMIFMHANERRPVLRSFCMNENTICMHANVKKCTVEYESFVFGPLYDDRNNATYVRWKHHNKQTKQNKHHHRPHATNADNNKRINNTIYVIRT